MVSRMVDRLVGTWLVVDARLVVVWLVVGGRRLELVLDTRLVGLGLVGLMVDARRVVMGLDVRRLVVDRLVVVARWVAAHLLVACRLRLHRRISGPLARVMRGPAPAGLLCLVYSLIRLRGQI